MEPGQHWLVPRDSQDEVEARESRLELMCLAGIVDTSADDH